MAIEAALRRFDGGEELPSTADGAGTGGRPAWWVRPQLGLAMAACLVAVIGIPVALTVIRDGNSPDIQASAPPSAPESRQEGTAQGISAPTAPFAESAVESVAQAPSAILPAQRQGSATTVATNKPADELAAAESSTMADAAPAPPSPPPAAPMFAEKSAGGVASNNIVVTGSRIRAPNADREEIAAARAQTADVQAATDRVLKDASYATFLKRLQAAVRTNDRSAVIKLVSFPLRVNSNGRSRLYPDARSVRANYDRIFTPKVTQAILGQQFDRLFGRDQGLMIGDGEIWFDHICSNSACSPSGPVRIKAVNL
ncbi:MAG: hypothetical protein ABI422_07310 [Sphingomicrobium sp.]